MTRPAVSVVLPFVGARDEGAALAAALGVILAERDEAIIADNTPDAVCAGLAAPAGVRVLITGVKRSPYAARNEAAALAKHPWLLFTDSDCRWPAGLLDAYFAPPPGDRTGAVAGEVAGAPEQTALAARYARARSLLRQEPFLRHHYRPMAVTANLLVRAQAFAQIGGFQTLHESGGDADLSWRLQEAGWTLEHRPGAEVEHEHRETVRGLLRQVRRTSSGQAWLERRHPGATRRTPLAPGLVRAAGGALVFAARGQRERAAFKLVDGLVVVNERVGRAQGERAYGSGSR